MMAAEESNPHYCFLSNIPSIFHASDLRNFFSVFVQAEKFDMFHFRHRPQILNILPAKSSPNDEVQQSHQVQDSDSSLGMTGQNTNSEAESTSNKLSTTTTTVIKKFCCPIRFLDAKTVAEFIKKYHGKCWIDKAGNELPSRAIISKVDLTQEDLSNFNTKEFRPPKFMPRGNIGTPNAHFLNEIKECRLPPSLIKKLGLEFPRGRVHKTYSNVPFDYKTSVKGRNSKFKEEEDEEVTTGKGHTLSSVYIPKHREKQDIEDEEDRQESDKESNIDDDDDRCEEWERHEALNDHTTSHGTFLDEDKERLFEDKIELQWEKGGPGVVFYTDANFWNDQQGDFDEQTADDLDVDMEGYYVPGAGDKDARDFMEMRRSERFQQGLEDITVFAPKHIQKLPRPPSPPGPSSSSKDKKIGTFEKYTRGIGRKILEQHGWKDGQGLGTTIIGMADALDNEGHGPMDRRGFGYYGEKIEYKSRNPRNRPKDFQDYRVDAPDRIVIGTIYDKLESLDVPEPVLRRNAPYFIKRYEFVKGPVQK